MVICPKCNTPLAEDAKFCDACGSQIFATTFCPNCGGQTSTEFAFCQMCGTPIAGIGAAPVAPDEPVATKKKKSGKSSKKKVALFVGIGIVVLAIALAAFLLLRGGSGKKNYSLYLRDGDICYSDFSKDGSFEITSRLTYGKNIKGTSEVSYGASALGALIAFSEDGNRIFFPDRFENLNGGVTLYYRDLNKKDKDAEKIDSDVTLYAINKKGTQVVYLKGKDNTLYLHDLAEKEKIASNVLNFHVTDDLKKIGYVNDEGGCYLWTADKDAEKLASDVSNIVHFSEDLSVFYYMKDGSLYKQPTDGGDKLKIASDVKNVLAVYDSGEVYYTKEERKEINLLDYVTDDMAEADASVKEPSYPAYPDAPKYPYWWDYDTDAEYEAAKAKYDTDYKAYEEACRKLDEAYNAALDQYYEKLGRDYLREELKNEKLDNIEYKLFYFDGTNETVVTDALTGVGDTSCAYDKPAMVLSIYNKSDVKKVKFSEITSYNDVSSLVEEAFFSSADWYIALGSTLSVIEQEDAYDFRISSDGSLVFFLDELSEEGNGDLYTIKITDGQVGKRELLDSDVNKRALSLTHDNKIVYYKDVSDDGANGTLFIDGKEIDDDVILWVFSYLDDGAVLYYTDWNSKKSYGTLMMFKDGNKTKISDDVHDYVIAYSGDILYLYDYSTNYYSGTLYTYNDGDPKKIDDDVAAIITVSNDVVRGRFLRWRYSR